MSAEIVDSAEVSRNVCADMIRKIILSSVLLLATSALAQQAPAPAGNATPAPRPAQASLQVSNPHYDTISVSVAVNASADKVWARVGKFCDIGKTDSVAGGNSCKYLAGNGGPGTVRSIDDEVLVGTTKYSYTYAQAPRENTLYNFYHGTLQVVPVTATTSRLNHVIFLDTSMLVDYATRAKVLKDLDTSLNQKLQVMKALAEGGKLRVPQTAAARPAAESPQAAFQNANPRYVAIPMQVEVNAPADVVWAHIGHFCDIGKIGSVGFPTCMIVEGTDGEYGVVRNVGREVLVGKTADSYTYSQQMRATGFYSLYHGTIEARAVTPKTSTLYWTLVYDNSNLTDDAAIERDITNRRTRFTSMLQAVKILSEGGMLPDAIGQPAAAAPAPAK
jgi:hypothetical protein